MSERYGTCHHCKGQGEVSDPASLIESREKRKDADGLESEWVTFQLKIMECGRCGGTGHSGSVFQPENIA